MNGPFSSRLKAVVFDLDGTLLDTAPEFVAIVNTMREEHALEPLPEDSIRAQVSNGARALVTFALGLTADDAEFETQRLHLLELYSRSLGTATTPYPGIEALLKLLAEHNILWGIATNKPSKYALPLLQKVKLTPAVASVVCPDHVGQTKPHPEPLYLACKQMGCKPAEVIYIGDHQRDIQAGRRAGMYTIAAAYGYIEPGDDPTTWGAASVAHCSTELPQLIASALRNDS